MSWNPVGTAALFHTTPCAASAGTQIPAWPLPAGVLAGGALRGLPEGDSVLVPWSEGKGTGPGTNSEDVLKDKSEQAVSLKRC